MRSCTCCKRPTAPTAANVVAPMVWSVVYLICWNCACGSTQAVVIWESEE